MSQNTRRLQAFPPEPEAAGLNRMRCSAGFAASVRRSRRADFIVSGGTYMKKRFLSLLLVLVLIMSLMPAALAVNADDAQPKTISVTFRLHTDTDEWIAPTEVSDLPEGTSVFTVFQKVLADKGYTYEYHEQYCYVQAITAPDGTRLAEFSKGQNSGWLFRVNNDFADVGMNDFVLMDGDEIEVLYTADYEKEPGMSLPYTDVSWDHWAYTAIKRMYTRGLMVGVNETTFAPGQEMSRAMLAVILYARAGQPAVEAANPFTDVPADSWYTDAVIWAADNGIVSGFGDGAFRPNDALTRAQAAVMLCAFAAFTQDDVTVRADLSAYSDAGQIPSWAMDAMQWANARQLIIGRDSAHLAPTAATTRAEMASILSAYIRK
jgi:hypothetical protein